MNNINIGIHKSSILSLENVTILVATAATSKAFTCRTTQFYRDTKGRNIKSNSHSPSENNGKSSVTKIVKQESAITTILFMDVKLGTNR